MFDREEAKVVHILHIYGLYYTTYTYMRKFTCVRSCLGNVVCWVERDCEQE